MSTVRGFNIILRPLFYAQPFPENLSIDRFVGTTANSPSDQDQHFVPDLDELAGATGRAANKFRWIPKIASRMIMGLGAVWALWGFLQTWKELAINWQTAHEVYYEHLNSKDPKANYDQQARRNSRNFICNCLLGLGTLGMAINLLASAELLGGLWLFLQPCSIVAMGISAPMMALYGALLPCLAFSGHYNRNNSKVLLTSLAISGVLQSVGAILQLTPWSVPALIPLLLGTIGIMICHHYLDKDIKKP